MNIAVLGAGMVGSAIAKDLAKIFEITVFDNNDEHLKNLHGLSGINIKKQDLSVFADYKNMLSPFNLVVSALPGFMGYRVLETVIDCGKNIVDISFFPENALDLHAAAVNKGVTAIVDCGVAPGMSNLILGYYNSIMEVKRFDCMVGGLPKIRRQPFEYKAPFSPADVIEEYSRPARYVENGQVVTKPAMSEVELVDFEETGTLESFNTDGLRSILYTMQHIPDMKEKTLRYPGHVSLMQSLFMAGFFSKTALMVNNIKTTPFEVTTQLLFDQWKLLPGEKEFTIMQIAIEGIQEGKWQKVNYKLYDEYDDITGISSMSRTTGYTCAAAVNLIAGNHFNKHGVYPPELIGGENNCFKFILRYLEQRNVFYKKSITN